MKNSHKIILGLFALAGVYALVLISLSPKNAKVPSTSLSGSLDRDIDPTIANLQSQLSGVSSQVADLKSADLIKIIELDYFPKLVDRKKILLIINPLRLTFLENGNYNIIVRANPVSIYKNNVFVQDLEGGNYFIDVQDSTITII